MAMRYLGWLALVALLAGCIEAEVPVTTNESSSAERPTSVAAAPSAAPKKGLGSVRVTIVTGELEPVEGAEVVLADTVYGAYSDAAGLAVFNDLEPGPYTVLAAKPGFQSVQDKGRIAEVEADEVVDVKLTLNPVTVVSGANAYHKTHAFRGFIACSFEGRTIGYTSYCGRGLQVQGQDIGRDPNDNSTHAWSIENVQIQGVILEAKWTPSFATLGTDLRIRSSASYRCDTYHCSPGGAFQEATGSSPLRASRVEGTGQNMTKTFGTDAARFPAKVWSEGRAYCSPSCNINILIQQRYDMFGSAFYGAEPTAEFTALPR